MTRPAHPTQLHDCFGNEVRLPAKPFATGGEGAVFDVLGRPELVAKLYSKRQNEERCDKLRAMAKLCSPDLLKIAAWPTATLSKDHSAAVEGILMPRIAEHKEIHHLYSVAQRKKDFPEADWGFLLHTARNCAIAFESIHSHGHIVGDVNQKNVMVSKKGIVALVDCDSFQVKEGTRIFRCGVGVPEYTPPELHGRKFADLDRDANHDLFGLAVMIFHLLMMGRHPFAGVPQINTDIPIEMAIKDGYYAYARNPSKLKPPPHVPPLMMLDIPTRDLFERAFCSRQRPTATEWRNVLDASMKGLQRCKNDPKHSYPAGGSCPWCHLIAVARLMFFIPSQGAAGATLRIEDIRNLIQTLTSMRLMLTSYTRPSPLLPIEVKLPANLRSIQKPTSAPHPTPPAPLQRHTPTPLPPPPVLLAPPILRPLPAAPAIPLAPMLKPYPPKPVERPCPTLHAKPPTPVYPPVPIPPPPDLFLERLFIVGAAVGGLIYFVAWPVGATMMFGFGTSWLLMKVTEGVRHQIALKSLNEVHESECAQMDEEYGERLRPIQKANERLLRAWKAANTTETVEHAELCRAVDDENRRRAAPWEATKALIVAYHQLATCEVEQENRRVLSAWNAENARRQLVYDQLHREIEAENRRRQSDWTILTASRRAEHHQECRQIDATNRHLIATWESANAPWIDEQKRWRARASTAEAQIKRIEDELATYRQATISRFQHRKANADAVLRSHDGARQDYEKELRQAEMDSKNVQLQEHLDKSLIRDVRLKGITGDRILSLESFGIQTAKDIAILNHHKVPGIGPVLSKRLFDWRDRLASSFRPQQRLPESEKKRIAARYAPVLVPLVQVVETAIKDLETIATTHRATETELIQKIVRAVQEFTVAEAHIRTMRVV